jgi:hypothetical protein
MKIEICKDMQALTRAIQECNDCVAYATEVEADNERLRARIAELESEVERLIKDRPAADQKLLDRIQKRLTALETGLDAFAATHETLEARFAEWEPPLAEWVRRLDAFGKRLEASLPPELIPVGRQEFEEEVGALKSSREDARVALRLNSDAIKALAVRIERLENDQGAADLGKAILREKRFLPSERVHLVELHMPMSLVRPQRGLPIKEFWGFVTVDHESRREEIDYLAISGEALTRAGTTDFMSRFFAVLGSRWAAVGRFDTVIEIFRDGTRPIAEFHVHEWRPTDKPQVEKGVDRPGRNLP